MATIKSYTDINQAKTLREILPLESADMHYGSYSSSFVDYPIPNSEDDYKCGYTGLPCWSLASLLGVLPEIQGGKPVIALDDNYITYPHMSNLHTKADNLIDACVAMIEKLHELNLL